MNITDNFLSLTNYFHGYSYLKKKLKKNAKILLIAFSTVNYWRIKHVGKRIKRELDCFLTKKIM